MKAKIVLLILFVSMFLFSCAQQLTVREREMKKYDEIDVSMVEGMPRAITETVKAYNNGDYKKASIGFYAVMKNKEWDRLHDTARYYYAESLFRMGLFQAAEYQLAEILFEGPEGHYFVSSLLKLLAVTYETHDERVLFAVLSTVDYTSLPQKFANELKYYLGKINFYQGNDEVAIQQFSQVKDYSSFYPKAIYFLGVIQVRSQMYAEAMKSFMEIQKMPDDKYVGTDIKKLKGMAKLALGELYYAAAWKSQNKLAMFNVALNYFNRVGRDNEQWFEALFARTWASLLISRFDSTLGTVITLRSPFFQDIYYPEINIVEAVTHYNLCRYEDVNGVIGDFFAVYPGYGTQMATFLESVSTKTGLEVYKEVLTMYTKGMKGDKNTALPHPVMRTVLRDPLFRRRFDHIKEIERELALVEASSMDFKKSVIAKDIMRKLMYQLTTLRDESGRWIIAQITSHSIELRQLLADMKAIQFEMTDKRTKKLEKIERFGEKVAAAKAKKARREMNPSVPQDSYYWPFDGEYWEDELGYYFYNVENLCED